MTQRPSKWVGSWIFPFFPAVRNQRLAGVRKGSNRSILEVAPRRRAAEVARAGVGDDGGNLLQRGEVGAEVPLAVVAAGVPRHEVVASADVNAEGVAGALVFL